MEFKLLQQVQKIEVEGARLMFSQFHVSNASLELSSNSVTSLLSLALTLGASVDVLPPN